MGGLRRNFRILFVGAMAACASALSALPASAATTSTSWPFVAYDLQHTGYNPNETTIGAANVNTLGQLWKTPVAANSQAPYIDTQPVVAAGVTVGSTSVDLLYAGNENGNLVAVNASTGTVVWQRALGWQLGGSANPDCAYSPFGISDSPVIDRSTNRLYVVDGQNELWGLDLSTGATAPGYPIAISSPSTSIYEHVWSGLNELNGNIYIPVASECDAGPYRGRVVVVNASKHSITSTFYVNGATGATGGGIWGWGGVSFDPSGQHIFLATGNALGTNPNAGHSDSVIKLNTSNLSISSYNDPGITGGDTDFGSTPVLFQQTGCPAELAVQSKNGKLYLYDQGKISQGPLQSIPVSVAKGGSFIGDAAWSPSANLLFVGVASGLAPYSSGLLAFKLVPSGTTCTLSLAWQRPLGPGLSDWPVPPPVVANGVVYLADGLAQTVTAVNATTGAALWSANLPGQVQTSPTIVNGKLYAVDYSGNIYAFALGAGGTAPNQSTTPVQVSGLSGIAQVSAGGYHSLALSSSGSFSAWGSNANGRLGDGTTTDRNLPISVSGLNPAPPPAGAVSAGWDHSLGLESDGTVWAWGYNGFGQFGTGTTNDAVTPTRVSGLPAITQVSAGFHFSTALAADGSVWTWGNNSEGELGNGGTTGSSVPAVVSGVSGVSALAAGYQHVLALRSDGTVWAWGSNYDGQLGNGTNTSSLVPEQVPGLTGITAIAAGGYHNLALRSDGTVWAWGYGTEGQLGNNAAVNSLQPIQVPGITGATAIGAGNYHSLVVAQGGVVWAFGYNIDGELGIGTTTNSYVPVQVPGLSGVSRVTGGGFHTVALKSDGTVWTWGSNTYGQLGDGQ